MAKKRRKKFRTITVKCSGCRCVLLKYHKGGRGSLVKCYEDRIVEDRAGGKCVCPECGTEYARSIVIRGKVARKIISDRVFVKGMSRK